jgi:hypothetical protein
LDPSALARLCMLSRRRRDFEVLRHPMAPRRRPPPPPPPLPPVSGTGGVRCTRVTLAGVVANHCLFSLLGPLLLRPLLLLTPWFLAWWLLALLLFLLWLLWLLWLLLLRVIPPASSSSLPLLMPLSLW